MRSSNCLLSFCLAFGAAVLIPALCTRSAHAQSSDNSQEIQELRETVEKLSQRVDILEHQLQAAQTPTPGNQTTGPAAAAALQSAVTDLHPAPPSALAPATVTQASQNAPAPILPATLPGGATLNYTLDGYYEYNFNQPPGRVNDLRAYDVLSNTFSLNQADVVFDLEPDLSARRRYGFRLDLQFGQATETLQGNPANEPRPDIYRNIFQAYGSYIVPAGKGLRLDFGKWASSLGMEGNYTKDQLNYTRSFYFYFLPFYHQGIRASYQFNDKFAVNYWVVNGTNQSEPTNGYKDELFGYVLQPTKTLSWTMNYYLGQEHPNSAPATNCTIPVQPGLCVTPISPAPNGKLDIFDSYASWQALPRLQLALEGDYVIERLWANAAPGESSAPSHVDGGAAYAQYQLTTRAALAARAEYLSDRGGLFSGATQALKETTFTYKYNVADGLDAFLEFRHDWSNIPYFLTHQVGSPSQHQNTATLGLVWWYGGKQGAW